MKRNILDIKETLPQRLKKPSPPYFDRYSKKMLYSIFRKNKETIWYVFFNVYEVEQDYVFLVRYINNNHMIAQHFSS